MRAAPLPSPAFCRAPSYWRHCRYARIFTRFLPPLGNDMRAPPRDWRWRPGGRRAAAAAAGCCANAVRWANGGLPRHMRLFFASERTMPFPGVAPPRAPGALSAYYRLCSGVGWVWA